MQLQKDKWSLDIHYTEHDGDKVTKGRHVSLGKAQFGKWTQWEIEITWSQPGTPGSIQVNQDGKTYTDSGLNNYNLAKAPYFKQGIYRPHWKPRFHYPTGGPSAVVYIDNLTVSKF